MSNLTIPKNLRVYRTRALESMANVGIHAWDIHAPWDAEMDAQAYCIDAPGSMPAGSVRGYIGTEGMQRRVIRQDN
jgi:hypothetical protein